MVVRVPRGLIIAAAALVLAVGGYAWSRVTPDMSFFTNLFPETPATAPTRGPAGASSARVTEQATPETTGSPATETPSTNAPRAVVPPAARDDRGEAPEAAATRRALNELDAKKERLANARRNVAIVMYSTSWCKVCKDARSYLNEAGVAYEEYDVEKDHDADRRLRVVNPKHTVPTFDIDGMVLTGFSPGSFESMLTSAAARRAARE